ncbi:MAG TPA: helicase-related protein [Polyangia bacterium]|nr:helicase-related protein [Polyangia bacterium]
MPRAYQDLRQVTPIAAAAGLPDGTAVLVRGTVRRLHVFPRRLLDVFVEDGGATVRGRWFRAHGGMARAFPKGSQVALAGALHTARDGVRELLQPSVVTAALAERGGAGLGIRPRYVPIPGVPGRTLERMRAAALDRLRGSTAGEELAAALLQLHEPGEDAARVEAARRRVMFERAFLAQITLLARRAAEPRPAWGLPPATAAEARRRAEQALPFALTASQARAADELVADLTRERPMRRLLIGDVGSGKTAVAFLGASLIAAAGARTLMMVPTEVLAEQQARAIGAWAAAGELRVAALTGGMAAAARAAVVERWNAGAVDLLIGTHALLTAGLAGDRLGLVVVDEQHRFGVAQRTALSIGGASAHLLSMSATPIPRSLALVLHGDLDASFLTERPAGRRGAATAVCATPGARQAAWDRLRDAVGSGGQAFVVCPVREEARRAGAVTALAAHARLVRSLAPVRVGLLHGALPSAGKERALRAFAAGETQVLVATTVVELGIDVPNASVMMIEEADRLGLAQLHQLRGRVGRGARPGLCFLLASDGLAAESSGMARLEQLAGTDDGFRVAELDLAQRGFGDLLGTDQAGSTDPASLAPAELGELFQAARRQAEATWAADPGLRRPEHAALARAVADSGAVAAAGEAG